MTTSVHEKTTPPGPTSDYFFHPTDGWLLLARAVTYDNWLTWRHVLPADAASRGKLTKGVCSLITPLAAAIDSLHRKAPGYHQLADSPYEVLRWWDPLASDGWEMGNRCQFIIRDVCPKQFYASWKRSKAPITVSLVNTGACEFLEASFP